ncbi:MAG TPA: type II toxin-antitoxin system RelE/ParE family toxin [Candidatus Kapabacteria bacterium]|nr:type II toxin-antitoxin system RelE/ParE family toxin [Candidatus Kapabacteria bacterium]
MTIRYHLEAVEEYDWAVRYYSTISPPLAARLINEVERCMERISNYPLQGKEVRPGIRAITTKVFPYDLIYMMEEDVATILAVAHQKRDPEYWLHRVN